VVDPERYPNYDLSLMQAFQQETELFVGSTLREDRSVVDLLDANYTFVTNAWRGTTTSRGSTAAASGGRISQPRSARRAARAGRAAGDDVVSRRTSPVLARQMAAEQHLRLPVPPPPPGRRHQSGREQTGHVPASIREQLAQHRAESSCSSCSSVIIRSVPLRISTSSADGGPSTNRADPSTRRGHA